MNTTFTWWLFNLGVTLVWLAIVVKSGSWFLALGAVVYLAVALLVELPETSSRETPDDDRGEGRFG